MNYELISSRIVAAIAAFIVATTTFAQSAEPTITFYSTESASDVEMSAGEEQSAPAPLEITMRANLEDDAGWKSKCEWKIYTAEAGEEHALLDRFEENSTYTFNQSGSYCAKLYVTFTQGESEETFESEEFKINISTSKLSCPDGFSPNGDEVNDVFKITYQSIIKMSGAFFNRWGQKVYSFDLSNVDQGWDGRQNGKYVKDGVYFLNLQAEGSDGVKYNIKKAVNVMKGLRDYNE